MIIPPRTVSVDPPTTIVPLARLLPDAAFTMQKQQQTNWCWSAVAVSIHNFLHPELALLPTWNQATLATKLLNDEAGGGSLNCSLPKEAASVKMCNKSAELQVALTITSDLAPAGFLEDSVLSFESLQKWVVEQLPVCARVVWEAGGAHFIALDGCAMSGAGKPLVHVQDPDNKVAPSFWDYDALVESYRHLGHWQDSYLLKK